tara:strand:- start:27581 stop:28108 length:528 start_codon:yes stop_codon:yes gene_type:complete
MKLNNKKAGIRVEGIQPFLDKIEHLGPKIQGRVALAAVKAASAEVRKKGQRIVKSKALGDGMRPSGQKRIHLWKSIINKAKAYGKDKIPVGTIGTQYKVTPHDHLVHDGTSPHIIKIPKKKPLFGRQLEVRHPGARAFPFMKFALEESREAQQKAMVNKILKRIEVELQKDKDKK